MFFLKIIIKVPLFSFQLSVMDIESLDIGKKGITISCFPSLTPFEMGNMQKIPISEMSRT